MLPSESQSGMYSATKQQQHDVLWAEVSKWLENSMVKNLLKWTKTKVYMIGHEQRWFATARTANKPENMQGFHEDYMLFVVDEASGVADPLWKPFLVSVLNIWRDMLNTFPQLEFVEIKFDDSGVGGGVTDRLNEVIAMVGG